MHIILRPTKDPELSSLAYLNHELLVLDSMFEPGQPAPLIEEVLRQYNRVQEAYIYIDTNKITTQEILELSKFRGSSTMQKSRKFIDPNFAPPSHPINRTTLQRRLEAPHFFFSNPQEARFSLACLAA